MQGRHEKKTDTREPRTTNKRAVITEFGGPEVIDVIEIPSVPDPGSGDVRIAVEASSAVFTDTLVRRGIYPNLEESPPFTPGYDLVGVVDAVGEGVAEFGVGERVADLTRIGANAEYVIRPAKGLVSVPEGIDPVAAETVVLSYVTAYQLYRVSGIDSGQKVLIHGGSGAVGTALLQLGQNMGLEMVTTASERSAEWMDGHGATIIEHTDADYTQQLRDAAGDGFDAAFDAVGLASYFRSYRLLKSGGTLVAYGFTGTVRGIEKRTLGTRALSAVMFGLLTGSLALVTTMPNGRSATFYDIDSTQMNHPDRFAADLTELFELMADGHIDPVITKRLPLHEAARAHELLDSGIHGRVVLVSSGATDSA